MVEHVANLEGLSRGSTGAVPAPRARWAVRIGVPTLVAGILAGLLVYGARDWVWPARGVEVVPVMVRAGMEGQGGGHTAASGGVQAPGWVEADPFPTYVSGLADGVIREVLVLEGQPVKAGQVVARLVDDDAKLSLERSEAELKQAVAEEASARAALTAAKSDAEFLTERKRMQAATAAQLAQVKAELARHPAMIAVEQAKLQELEQDWAFKKRLVDQNAVSELEGIQARNRAEGQRAVVEAIMGETAVQEGKVKELEAELAAAQENLRLKTQETKMLEEAQAALAKAQAMIMLRTAVRDEAALRLKRMDVCSPVDGIVMSLLKQPGDTVMLNGNMARPAQVMWVYDPAHMQVRVDVPLAEASKVSVGQGAQVVVGVLPDKTFEGHITRVVHVADIQKNTVQVKVSIKNPGTALKPEMLARVRFLPQGARTMPGSASGGSQRVFVPEELVRHSGDQQFVWVVEGNKAAKRVVSLEEMRMEGWVAVASGLQPGDRVIAGSGELRGGERIRVTGEAKGAGHGAH